MTQPDERPRSRSAGRHRSGCRPRPCRCIEQLVADKVASRLAAPGRRPCGARTPSPRRRIRLAWTTLHETSRAAGPARSRRCATSCGPRAWTASCSPAWAARRWPPRSSPSTAGVPLVVLDTTDPGQVADALEGDLSPHGAGRVVQVGVHGGDRQPPADLRAGVHRRRASTPASRIVVVTDPGSPLRGRRPRKPATARCSGPTRTSAAATRRSPRSAWCPPASPAPTSAHAARRGTTAAAEAGAATPSDNPALLLAAALGAAHTGGAEKVVLADTGSGITGFGEWAEQLIAGVHRQGRHRPAAGRGRGPGRARLRRRRTDATPVAHRPGDPSGVLLATDGPPRRA